MTIILMAVPQESDGLIEVVAKKANIQVIYTGIGFLSSCAKTVEVILKYKPTHILNLGTAGSRLYKAGDLVECVEFKNRTVHVLELLSRKYTSVPITNLPQADCGSGDFIDYSENAKSFSLLDMEAYAIADVCHKMNVKFNAIKYVTDDSSGDVGKKWRENLKSGAKSLADKLDRLIQTKVLS